MNDIITALATPPGVGGIAVIRLSGKNSAELVDICFKGKIKIASAEPYTIHYGKIYDDENLIDTILVSVFKEPNSYTGEDSIEISCHGGVLVASEIITLLIKNGARLAEPGEFTKRAFLNGKLDLTQVEAVADLIHSSSIPGSQTSARQLTGEFTKRLAEFRKQLLKIAGLLELELDFAEEDIELISRKELEEMIKSAMDYCLELAQSHKTAEILRSGYFIGIAGYPNAGKSRLFNAMLQKNRAIVSEIAGTTRDYIEENIMLGGIIVRLIDTAGLRETSDTIEIEGIKMVESVMEQSNMILILNDIGISESNSDKLHEIISKKYPDSKVVLVQNKIDVIENLNKTQNQIYISAKNGDGLEELKSFIEQSAKENIAGISDILVNQRQANLLIQSAMELGNALKSFKSKAENELIAIDIRNSARKLGEITGESWSEEVLNNIFGNFCIGK